MKKLIVLYIFLLFCLETYSQQNSEFEGVISYKHIITPLVKNFDTTIDRMAIGYTSDYYYKTGKYRWDTYNCYYLMDLYRSEDSMNYYKLNYHGDTLFSSNHQEPSETIINYKVEDNNDTIIGYHCKVLIVEAKFIGSNDGNGWKRRFYFCDKLPVSHSYFENYKSNSQDFVFSIMQALPLKIVTEYPVKVITWEATKVMFKKLDDDIFNIIGTPIKPF